MNEIFRESRWQKTEWQVSNDLPTILISTYPFHFCKTFPTRIYDDKSPARCTPIFLKIIYSNFEILFLKNLYTCVINDLLPIHTQRGLNEVHIWTII